MLRGNSDVSQRVKKKVTMCHSLESGMISSKSPSANDVNRSATTADLPKIRIQPSRSPPSWTSNLEECASQANSMDMCSDTSQSVNTETDLFETDEDEGANFGKSNGSEDEEDDTVIEETSFVTNLDSSCKNGSNVRQKRGVSFNDDREDLSLLHSDIAYVDV